MTNMTDFLKTLLKISEISTITQISGSDKKRRRALCSAAFLLF